MRDYIGRVTRPVSEDGRSGWIAISSVSKNFRWADELTTTRDIFVHVDAMLAVEKLTDGMEIGFDVEPDTKRGGDAVRVRFGEETEQGKAERFANGGVTLTVQSLDGSRILLQPSVFVTWCVSADVAASIRDERLAGLPNPKLLIVEWVVDKLQYTERRYLFNLDDPMGVVEFNRGGAHRIMAIVTYTENLLVRKDRRYVTDVVDDAGARTCVGINLVGSTVLDVEIPEELFAKRPSDWAWVNRWFEEPPFDQCAFRRRRAFAYFLQPFLMAFGYVLGAMVSAVGWACSLVIAFALLLMGMKRINTYPLLHPWLRNPKEVWRRTPDESIFWPPVEGQKVPFAILLHPFFVYGVWRFANWMLPEPVPVSGQVDWLLFGFLFAGLTIVMFILGALAHWMSRISDDSLGERLAKQAEQEAAARAARREREERQVAARKAAVEAEVAALICDATSPRAATIEHLPLTRRTLKFHFVELKRRVCRPFAS